MTKGIKLFRVLGIRISLDYSWFIIFVVFGWSLAYGYFPHVVPGLEKPAYLVIGVVSALLLFVCVLVHEISHAYTSNKLGLEVKGITLFIFGGVAELSGEPEDAWTELKVAIAGPIASAVLAVVFRVAAVLVGSAYPALHAVLAYLSLINIVLLIFNMIPGFPLDGGRVLRAIWWARTGNIASATLVASRIGTGFAFFLIMLGFFQIFTANFIGGLWMILIGVFLRQAAEGGYQQMLVKRALADVKVGDIMTTAVITVDGSYTISEAVEELFLKHHVSSFPVVVDSEVVGLLTIKDIRTVGKDVWKTMLVTEAMTAITPKDTLSPDDDAMAALSKMVGDHAGRLVVLEHGRLVGILSRRDLMRTLELKAGLCK